MLMDSYELRTIIAALVAGAGGHTATGAVALGDALIREVRDRHPDEYSAHVRRRLRDAERAAKAAQVQDA
jgi:hypothetical protein